MEEDINAITKGMARIQELFPRVHGMIADAVDEASDPEMQAQLGSLAADMQKNFAALQAELPGFIAEQRQSHADAMASLKQTQADAEALARELEPQVKAAQEAAAKKAAEAAKISVPPEPPAPPPIPPVDPELGGRLRESILDRYYPRGGKQRTAPADSGRMFETWAFEPEGSLVGPIETTPADSREAKPEPADIWLDESEGVNADDLGREPVGPKNGPGWESWLEQSIQSGAEAGEGTGEDASSEAGGKIKPPEWKDILEE